VDSSPKAIMLIFYFTFLLPLLSLIYLIYFPELRLDNFIPRRCISIASRLILFSSLRLGVPFKIFTRNMHAFHLFVMCSTGPAYLISSYVITLMIHCEEYKL
jgi:hypothetical protein